MKKSSFVQALIHNHYVGTGKKSVLVLFLILALWNFDVLY